MLFRSRAILDCKEPTVLLIAGKGTETYQKRGQEYVATPTDGEYAKAFLREYDMLHRLNPLEKAEVLLSLLPALEHLRGRTLAVAGDCPEVLRSDLDSLPALGIQVLPASQPTDLFVIFADTQGLSERMDPKRAGELLESGQLSGKLSSALRRCLERGAGERAILEPQIGRAHV